MRTKQAEELFRTGVERSVFKAARHIPVRGSPFGEDIDIHVYPLRSKGGFLWAIRRHDYGPDRRLDGLAILRAGIFRDIPITGAARAAVAELYKPPPRKRPS